VASRSANHPRSTAQAVGQPEALWHPAARHNAGHGWGVTNHNASHKASHNASHSASHSATQSAGARGKPSDEVPALHPCHKSLLWHATQHTQEEELPGAPNPESRLSGRPSPGLRALKARRRGRQPLSPGAPAASGEAQGQLEEHREASEGEGEGTLLAEGTVSPSPGRKEGTWRPASSPVCEKASHVT